MSNAMYAILFAVGAGAWVYSLLMKHSNEARNSVIGAGAVAVVAFFVFFTIFNMVTG